LEAFVDEALVLVGVLRRPRFRDRLRERHPLVVRAENRRTLDAADVERRLVEPIRPDEPDRSAGLVRRCVAAAAAGEGQQPAIRAPPWSGRVERRIRYAARRRAAIGGHDPHLTLAAV